MKIFLTIAFLFCSAAAVFAQRVQSDCNAPDSVKKMYGEPAAWMAYQFERDTQSPYLDSAILPQFLQDKFMNALVAVYNVKGIPQSDTVTRTPLPHDYVYPEPLYLRTLFSLGTMMLRIDTSENWQKRWVNHLLPTGNSAFDSLLNKYAIVFDTVYLNYSGHWIGITHTPYNAPILDSLIDVAADNFHFAIASFIIGDGDKVEGIIQTDSSVQLKYSLGWGDCILGCMYRKYWQFTVFPDCSVRFDTSYTRTPYNWSVDVDPSFTFDVTIQPNPASNMIMVAAQPYCTIELLDIVGKTIQSTISQEERTELSISSLPKGIYFVRATNKYGKHSTVKFIKD